MGGRTKSEVMSVNHEADGKTEVGSASVHFEGGACE